YTTPLWKGIGGLLFSPGRSVFLYAPPLALAVALWSRFRRHHAALADVLALLWIMALVFYGGWWAWHGGWCWGPRFLVPLLPLSCLPLGALPDRSAWRRLALNLCVIGLGVQCAGVLTDITPHYAAVFGASPVTGDTPATAGDAYHRVNYTFSDSPLAAGLRRLVHAQTEPLALFHLADTGLPPTWAVGVPLLLLIGLGVGVRRVWATMRACRNAGVSFYV
ncbi:MAG: hypothetical protein JW966_10935, partial [Anaerolineae bacterium]|nr:hypothetical protein [Anaerolineae bacterium]